MELVGVRNARFHGHLTPRWRGGYGDLFVLYPPRTLPPWVWARIVRRAVGVLQRYRPTASVWVCVPQNLDGGAWWPRALREALMGFPVPIAVTSEVPNPSQFSFPPHRTHQPLTTVPREEWDGVEPLDPGADILVALARVGQAYTAEVASLALMGRDRAREILYALKAQGLVYRGKDRYPVWGLTRKGIVVALRLMGVPLSVPSPFRKEASGRVSGRHRRTARLWNAWLRRAGYTVRLGWTEVYLPGRGRVAADALAWGTYDEHETLFWLEVEGGTTSARRIRERIARRFAVAEAWVREQGLALIFVVLGRPWAVRAAAGGLRPRHAAVLLAAWTAFGELPRPTFGAIQEHHSLRHRRDKPPSPPSLPLARKEDR